MATQPGYDRSGARVGLTESHCRGRCWLRGYHGVSRGTGRSSTPLCRRYFLNDGSVEQTTAQAHVPRYPGRGAPATRYAYGKQRPTSAQDAAVQAKSWKRIRWRQGTKGWRESRFVALRVQPSHGFVRGQPPHKEVWLLIEWPELEKEPTKYFLCDLPATYTLRRLVRLHDSRWKIGQ